MTAVAYSRYKTADCRRAKRRWSRPSLGSKSPFSWTLVRVLADIAIAWALFASAKPLAAQVSATISGRIEDPTGAGVGGASVTVKSLDTGATRAVTTDDAGNFRVL